MFAVKSYAVEFVALLQTVLAWFSVAKEEACGADEPVVVNSHDYRHTCFMTQWQYGWRDERVEVVYVYDVGAEVLQRLAHHAPSGKTPDAGKEPPHSSPEIVA